MKIMEEFYYGNITPYVREIPQGSKAEKLLSLVAENEERLIASLNEEQMNLYQRYRESVAEMQTDSDKEAFIRGYQIGARMMMETLCDEDWVTEVI